MDITQNGVTIFARFVLLPVLVFGDFAISLLPVATPLLPLIQFALGYASMLAMLVAFREQSTGMLAFAVAILLVVAWAVGASGISGAASPATGDLNGMFLALGGALCAMLPASVRDWQGLAGRETHMSLAQLRLLRRRKRRGPVYLLPAPFAEQQRERDPMEQVIDLKQSVR